MTAPEWDFDVDEWKQGRLHPVPTDLTQPYWQGLRDDKLLVQRCRSCKQYIFRPEFACTKCFAPDPEWVESSGAGILYAFSIVHRPPRPGMRTPFVVGVVELAEGWHMMTNIVGCDPDEVYSSMPVVLRTADVGDVVLPLFERAASV